VDEAVEAEDLRTSEQPATVIARLDPRTAVRVDEQIEIGIAPGSLRFFDRDDGGAIAAASG
jgi:hypothetical protein